MNNKDFNKIDNIIGEYKYGFTTDVKKEVVNIGKGLNLEVVKKISEIKQEPQWMLEIRMKAYHEFASRPLPKFGPDLSFIDFDDYTYYIKTTEEVRSRWEEVPEEIKETFEKLGIPEAERKFLAGVTTQFESEAVYHNVIKELEEKGVIFCDTDTAVRKYPEIVKEYFGTVVPYNDNKFAALNTAVWSGGSFIYVPKGVKLEKPLQSYFRINSEQMGQFERTLIIVEEGASLHYVEGCTAPIYSKDSLHAAVVEIIVKDDAYCRYTTIQNWSNNIVNLVTKRAIVDRNAHMEWIDGNIGSMVNMKYPACILRGEGAKGTTISIAFAGKNQIQDAGAKMIHLAPNTSSNIVSKSICRGGGQVNYRGLVRLGKRADNARSRIECDTIILDSLSKSDTIPTNIVENKNSYIEHEATVSKVSEEQLFYLMSRGLTEEQALEMIVMGFIEPFARELPMEYAVELNQLIKLEMEGSIG
ncbi:MAG: Fe-S cluster assembly protein SufB [Acholeplasmataceae bacterium]|nr:Fe-S cluster assembly protein SufB [Acholeplasmataceae bacterium]HPT89002.1 Fe-S cluster assembly protein SufB [Bacilli bacterium]